MNTKKLSVAALLSSTMGFMTTALAFPEYVAPTGASGCTDCHLTVEGKGFKPGILDAAKSGLPGLKEFLHPTPVKVGDTKPVLLPVNEHWDITVGGLPLVIPLLVSDAEYDIFAINVATPTNGLPVKGAVISQELSDAQSNLPVVNFKWQPTAAHANKTYTVNFTAQEKGAGRKLLSNTVTTTITVWPKRQKQVTNISQFKVQRAQWGNNQLNLTGSVIFKSGLTTAQRNAALKSLDLNMRTNSGAIVGSALNLTVDASGSWKKSVPLKASNVPCIIKLEYEGLNASSSVKLHPKVCVQ
jgi:hypothetical protein